MFDARSLLEQLIKGPAAHAQPHGETANKPTHSDGLGDLLNQITGGQGGTSGNAPDLGDLLRNLTGGQPSTSASQSNGPDMMDTLRNVFGQATEGARDGASKVGQATGLDDMIRQLSGGRDPQEVMAQLQELVRNNQLGTGAALGGLGALILGTQTGRSVAMTAAKVGALALIGGLAYKAYQNYQDGRPLIDGAQETPQAAPDGSGFDDQSIDQDEALRLVRAMVAASASDGRLDEAERQRLVTGMAQSGLNTEAETFLARELQNPASFDELTAGVTSEREAVKLYTAARLAIDPDTDAEQSFLAILASRLGLDDKLTAHIDAQARGMAAA